MREHGTVPSPHSLLSPCSRGDVAEDLEFCITSKMKQQPAQLLLMLHLTEGKKTHVWFVLLCKQPEIAQVNSGIADSVLLGASFGYSTL